MTYAVAGLLMVCSVVLIVSVLLQSGKSAGLSGSIAGGAEQLFGKQKARGYEAVFNTITKISAGLFLVCSLALAYLMQH